MASSYARNTALTGSVGSLAAACEPERGLAGPSERAAAELEKAGRVAFQLLWRSDAVHPARRLPVESRPRCGGREPLKPYSRAGSVVCLRLRLECL